MAEQAGKIAYQSMKSFREQGLIFKIERVQRSETIFYTWLLALSEEASQR
jgi:hypothetical protein